MNKTKIKILIFIALFFIGILVINNESQAASIPVVNIQGDLSRLTKDKNEENFVLTYTSTNLNFTKYVKMKLQGSSSLNYDKHNFTIKLYSDSSYSKKEKIDMGQGWGKFNKYCLKANVIDKTQARNIVTARIAAQAQAKFNIFDDTPNQGLIDGFPVQVNVNGSFYGLYTWNIAKDDFLWNLDKDDSNNIAVQAEMCNDYTYFKKQIESTTTIDDSKWEVEVGKDEEKENIKTKLNRLIKFVNESSDADFKANFSKYMNKDAMLNYLAIMYATEGYDNVAKNLILVTKDGNIWYPTLYDLDTTWGIRHSGILGKEPGKCDDYYWVPDGESKYKEYVPYGNDSVFLKKVIRCFSNELADRWFELRKDVLTYSNIKNEFEKFFAQIPQEVYTKEQNKWSYISAYGKWDKTQIYGSSSSFLEVRLPFVDNEMYKKYTVQPKLTVTYSTKSATRQSVIARVVPNREDLKFDEIMYTFTKNGTHTFTAKDYKGNTITATATVDWIDLTAPTLTVTGNPTSWTKSDVTLTIKSSDSASGLKSVTVNGTGVNLSSGQGTYKVTANGTYKVVATDNVGNTKEQSVAVSKIDKTQPTLEVTGNPSSWTKSDVTLTIKSSDSASGLKSVTVNGTAVTLSSGQGTYKVTANGTYKVVATDNVGNTKEQSVTVSKIDKTQPTLTVTGNPTAWTKSDVTLTIKAVDTTSGVKSVTVNGTVVTLSNGQGTYKVTVNGTYKIVVTDNVGNTKEQSVAVSKIDKTQPTLEVTGNPTSWTKSDVTLTIKASDTGSGMKNVTVNGTAVTLSSGQGTYKVTANGTYKIVATDNVGNTKEQSVTVNKIDKTGLTCEVVYSTINPTNNNIKVTIKANREVSGIEGWTLSKDKMELIKTYSSNKEEQVTLKDSLGNSAVAKIKITNIDKTQPTLEVTGNPSNWTKNDVTLTIKASDGGAGIKSVTVDGTAVTLSSGQVTYKVTQNGTYKVVATDNAGNTKEQSVTVSKIDKIKSTIKGITKTPETWTSGGVTLKVEAEDKESGIKEYSFDGGATWQTKNEKTYNKNTNGIKVQVKDNVGNVTEYSETINITNIKNMTDVIEIKNYTLENNMLKGIEPGTKVENLKENVKIKDAEKVKILNKENKEIKTGEKITTGSKVQINAFGEIIEYKIVVPGDTTGDGQADFNDMMKINLHRLNKIKLEGEYFEAGDINKDGKVDFTDFIKINLYRLKKIDVL